MAEPLRSTRDASGQADGKSLELNLSLFSDETRQVLAKLFVELRQRLAKGRREVCLTVVSLAKETKVLDDRRQALALN